MGPPSSLALAAVGILVLGPADTVGKAVAGSVATLVAADAVDAVGTGLDKAPAAGAPAGRDAAAVDGVAADPGKSSAAEEGNLDRQAGARAGAAAAAAADVRTTGAAPGPAAVVEMVVAAADTAVAEEAEAEAASVTAPADGTAAVAAAEVAAVVAEAVAGASEVADRAALADAPTASKQVADGAETGIAIDCTELNAAQRARKWSEAPDSLQVTEVAAVVR